MRPSSLFLPASSLALALALAPAARGAVPSPGDEAFSMLREEQTVTGASKRPQPLSETPSAVTVITAAEIHANGYHTLAEALRWVRGLLVTDDRNYSYLGVRGLQRPGDYNNKVLLALDGHTMNGNVFGDAAFGSELGLDLETVERIEVVRGPGSALYGGHAVLAVVNVVTRRPRSQPGGSLAGRLGALGERRGFASWASARTGQVEYWIGGSWSEARGADLYYPEFDDPATGFGRSLGADGENGRSLSGSAEWGGFHIAGRYNERVKHVPTGSFGTLFGDPGNFTVDGRDFLELSGTREIGETAELFARAWWDAVRYRGEYIYDYGPSAPRVQNQDFGYGDVLGAEFRANWSAGPGNVLTTGVEAHDQIRARLLNYDVQPYVLYVNQDPRSTLVAPYLQDELSLGNFRFTGGARVDDYSRFKPVLSPRADLVWKSSTSTTWKLLAGSAFRPPAPSETDYEAVDQLRAPSLLPERVATVEASVDRTTGPLSATLSAYRNNVRDLIDLVAVDSIGTVTFANRARVRAHGIEGELQLVPSSGTRLRCAVAWQESRDLDTDSELSNSPRWNGHLVLTHAPLGGRISLGAGVRYLSSRLTLAGRRSGAALVSDVRVGSAVGGRAELGLEVKNLFDARYGDPASREHTQDQLLQPSRAFYLTLSVHADAAR